MKRGLKLLVWMALVLAGSLCAANTVAATDLHQDILALHWHPASSDEAALRTLAAAAWLETRSGAAGWPAEANAHALRLRRVLHAGGTLTPSLADGVMVWLLAQQEARLTDLEEGFPEPELRGLENLLEDAVEGPLWRLRIQATLQADTVWRQLAERLGTEGEGRLADWWADLAGVLEETAEHPASWAEYARAQAERVRRLTDSVDADQRFKRMDAILRAQAEQALQDGRSLDWVWTSYEGLLRLLPAGSAGMELAAGWRSWLGLAQEQAGGRLRKVDVSLPVVVVQLQDAARYLAGAGDARTLAMEELADVYARLALFAPDMAFYLDQPVRSPVQRLIAQCGLERMQAGPLPRESFERCIDRYGSMLHKGLSSEELVGEARGPFALEFLRRELRLLSWQRAAYLDGHVQWLFAADCQSPAWVNVLDWSLLADHMVRWIWQRPLRLDGGDWESRIEQLDERMQQLAQENRAWLQCLTAQGSKEHDPVVRLLAWHQAALQEVAELLEQSRLDFRNAVVRPGGDVDLTGTVDQLTSYRPESLSIGPCPQAQRCGARTELPVSRALLNLFPNAHLLADQISMGEISLCYERVRWVERSSRPARRNDEGLTDYFGHLSFDLVGSFAPADGRAAETVFRYRLTDSESRHYLFANDDPEIAASDCPADWVGLPVASRFAGEHSGMMPNRLTYFVSAPTTPEALLLANWDRGAEWRDWFVTGQGTRLIEAADAEAMETAVRATLAELAQRRERQLYSPLINPPRAGRQDALADAMSRVADTAALLRRVLELHYPRIIRQHAPVRAMLVGEEGLITRDRVRQLRERGHSALEVPQRGLERAVRFEELWQTLPAALREGGQSPPEIDYALENFRLLQRLASAGQLHADSVEAGAQEDEQENGQPDARKDA